MNWHEQPCKSTSWIKVKNMWPKAEAVKWKCSGGWRQSKRMENTGSECLLTLNTSAVSWKHSYNMHLRYVNSRPAALLDHRYVLKPRHLSIFENISFIVLHMKPKRWTESHFTLFHSFLQTFFVPCPLNFFFFFLQYLVARSHIACKFNLVSVCLIATSSLSYQTISLETPSEARAIYPLELECLSSLPYLWHDISKETREINFGGWQKKCKLHIHCFPSP